MELKGNAVGIFLTGFVIILIGIIFTSTIADQTSLNTDLSSRVNESVTLTTSIGNVFNESVAITSGVGQLRRAGIRNLTFLGNGSINTNLNATTVKFFVDVNVTRSGVITVAQVGKFDTAASYNVSYTTDNNVTGTTANANVVSVTFFGDSNVSTHHSDIVVGQQVNFTSSTGVLNLASANFTARSYNVSYTFQGSNYVNDPTSRTFLSMNTLWFALFVLGAALVIVLRAYPELFNF